MDQILVIPDMHIPYHSVSGWSLLLSVVRGWQPDIIVIIGDFADMYAISLHDKDPSRAFRLEEELIEVEEKIQELDAAALPNASRRIYIEGNHEHRISRFIKKNPVLHNLRGLSFAELIRLQEKGWEFYPYGTHTTVGKLNLTHDVGYAGVNAVRQTGQVFESNVITGHCLPENYEVLTVNRGFVPLYDMLTTDIVYTYKNGAVENSPVKEVVKYSYSGEVAAFTCRGLSQTMTDKHHIYSKHGEYLPVREAINVLSKNDLVLYAEPHGGEEYPITDTWLQLVIAYCADGSRSEEPGGSVRFHMKKERKIARLTQLFNTLNEKIEWSESKTHSWKSKGITKLMSHTLFGLCPKKILPDWLLALSPRQRAIVIEELALWDGSILIDKGTDYGSRQFASQKKCERDLVQTLLLQQGILSRTLGINVHYNIRKRDSDASRKLKKWVKWNRVENVNVGCITTDADNFWIRTPEGRIELTGNTHRMAVHYFGNVRGESHVSASFGWLGDASKIDYRHRALVSREWQLGFGIGHMKENGTIHLQAVPIIRNECVVDGKLYSLKKGSK